MTIDITPLNDAKILSPKIWDDTRGYFFESYNQKLFNDLTQTNIQFVQDNIAFSKYGVVRGLHLQKDPFSQSKLVQVLQGKILDVIVDIRIDSSTFGKSFSIELSQENKKQLFVPKGFLHGYSVLSETAYVSYKCDGFYHQESEMGINPLDKTLNIDWLISSEKQLISDKDLTAISYQQFLENL